jgi:hypothetical protein
MGEKVTFHPATRIIQVDIAPTFIGSDWYVDLDVKIDLYSDGKEDWLVDQDLHKLIFAMGSAGGDPLPGGQELGATFFLEGGWKIRPYEANHIFRITGNLYSRDGSSPYIPTIGAYNVTIVQQVSVLVDSTTIDTNKMIDELHRLQGLQESAPLQITPTSRQAGDIDLEITGDGETSATVTRQ